MTGQFFVSYSHKDERWAKTLFEHGISTTRGVFFEWRDCVKITPGQAFDDEISRACQEAEGFALLVSRDFLESEYIQKYEWGWIRDSPGAERICWISIGRVSLVDPKLSEQGRAILRALEKLHRGGKLPARLPSGDSARLTERCERVRLQIARTLDPVGMQLTQKLEKKGVNKPRLIASGGLSHVFMFQGPSLGRKLAIKVPRDQRAQEAFDESLALAELLSNVPNFIPVYEIDRSEFPPHCVMELIEGQDLAKELEERARDGKRWPCEEVRHILLKLCFALIAANARSVHKHLNIRPSNILFDPTIREPFLSPMGRGSGHLGSKTLRPGMNKSVLREALAYRLPEHDTDTSVDDHRADVYLLGLVGYQLLTGQLPRTLENLEQLEDDLEGAPRFRPLDELSEIREDCPVLLASTVMRMVQLVPEKRYKSLDEVREALMRIPDEDLSRVERSWKRCLGKESLRGFVEKFYETFFAFAPSAKKAFKGPDPWPTPKQIQLLRGALIQLFVYYDLSCRHGRSVPPELNPLAAEAKLHAERQHVRWSQFNAFGKALVETAQGIECLNKDHPIVRSWQKVIKPGIEYMEDEFKRLRVK